MPPVLRVSLGLRLAAPALLVLWAVAGGNDAGAWAEGAIFVALVVGSAAVHEFGHVLAVRACGLTVHRVTLTMFGGLTQYFGPTPTRSGTAAIAAAGPVASAALATALLAAWVLTGEANTGPGSLLAAGVVMNVAITALNLLPVPSFDGGQILRAAFGRRTGRRGRPRTWPSGTGPSRDQARTEAASSSD